MNITPISAEAPATRAAIEAEYDNYLAPLFTDFHANPEMGFLENSTAAKMAAELKAAGLDVSRTPWSAVGLRVPSEPPPNIQALDGFKAGRFEIQDEGSQVVCWLAGAAPGMTVVDYCAGGGGKTLGLAQAMEGQGTLVAGDVVQKRLDNIRPRLSRAGVAADLRLIGQNGGGVEEFLDGSSQLAVGFLDANQ